MCIENLNHEVPLYKCSFNHIFPKTTMRRNIKKKKKMEAGNL